MTKASSESGISNLNLWLTPALTPKAFQALNVPQQLLYLCKIGHLAPSSHNTQPWRFRIDAKNFSIGLYLDRQFVLPVSDVAGRQAVISLGCAVENIIVACEYLGSSTVVKSTKVTSRQVLPLRGADKAKQVKICDINIKNSNLKSGNTALFKAIFSRKIMRTEFDPKNPLPEKLVKELKKISHDKRIGADFVANQPKKLSLSEFQGQADGFVINSGNFVKELGKWLLPNNSQSGLGMPGIGFGFQDKQALRIHLGFSGKQKLEPEDGLRFALGGKTALEKSPLIVLLSVEKDLPTFWLMAGRCFERMFLLLESQDYSVAVHAAIAEVDLINKVFAASSGTKKRLCILFRTGKVKNKADLKRPHAPRQSIENVLI